MKTLLFLLIIISCLNASSQIVYLDKEDITPQNITSVGGMTYYNNHLYLFLPASIRYDGKVVEASESKAISQKYRVWNVFRYVPSTGEMTNAARNWDTPNASPNGFCLVDDSTVIYTNNKSQLVSNSQRFNTLFLRTNISSCHFSDPYWDNTRKRLYFSSDYPDSKGGMDIYYIETEGNYAGIPVNAGTVNSQENELSPAWVNDSLMVYVSNSNKQQYDIIMHGNISFLTPEPTPDSEYFTISDKKDTLYFTTSNGQYSKIWKAKLVIRQIENISAITPVAVTEIPAETIEEPEPEQVAPREISPDDPEFRLDNYFGIAKFTLTPLMQDSLTKIAAMLDNDPSLSIVICGHSSPDGPEDKNMLLSSFRANEAYKWLINKGINSDRIFRVYGGEYLYGNIMFSRMFSVFPISATDDLPAQMAVVPAHVLGKPDKLYPTYGTDNDETEYWRFILKKQLPVEDKNLMLLPVKDMHYVLAGETLYSLSKRYGTTVEKMIEANGLKDATVVKGKILYVPAK